jgi:hypothetical protein
MAASWIKVLHPRAPPPEKKTVQEKESPGRGEYDSKVKARKRSGLSYNRRTGKK